MQANVLRKQGQAVRPVRQFSNAQMKLYFTEERCPKKAVWIICISGGLAILSACPGFWIFTGICALIALIQGAIVGWRLWYIPSDQQYDDWLEENRRVLASRGSKKLHLESKQAIKPYLRVQSFVLPGSSVANDYSPNEVCMKEGKDHRWRFSVNVFTYFYADEHYLAVFTSSISALKQHAPPIEGTEEYFYDDIVGATTFIDQDYASIQGQRYLYRIEKFSLRIVNGDNIDVSAFIRATALGSNQHGPTVIPPTTNIDQALAKLRQLLRFKRQWSI